jgi:hypothetical protein
MTRRVTGLLGALAATVLVGGSCIQDPLSDLDGNPAAIVTSHSELQLTEGGASLGVTAQVVDGRTTPLALPITFAPCDAAVSLAPDPSFDPVPATSARRLVSGVSPAASCVNVSAGGLTKAVDVIVLPVAFGGTVSNASPAASSTITVASTPTLKFDTSAVTVTFGGAAPGLIAAKTPDLLTVVVPFSSAGPLTIGGVDVTYVTGLRATLPTTTTVTQSGGNPWAAASDWQTAPDITSLLPAAGSASHMVVTRGTPNVAVCPELSFASAGPCMMFKFTLAATTTLNFTADWEGTAAAPDVDIYVCADTVVANLANDCFVDGGSGATGAKPQTTGNDSYAPGTYWFVVEIYDGTGPRNAYITIRQP